MRTVCTLAIPLLLLLSGCPDSHEHGAHDHAGEGHGGGGDIAVPATYAEAVAKCEELSGRIEGLIAEGKLAQVHPVAADIKKIAEQLPALAKADLPADALREVNLKATELAGMFEEIDAVADAGKKEETVAVHQKMKGLIATLKTQVRPAADGQAAPGSGPHEGGAEHGGQEGAGSHGGHDH